MSDYAGHLTTVANGSQWLTCRVQYLDDTDPFSSTNFPEPTRPPSYTFNVDLPLCEQLAGVHRLLKAPHKIDDCTLQISNTGSYLDLDLSINEQKEEFDNFFTDGKRNSVILRTQLSVRVHSCIEKLYNSKGRELRRALFSLKQIFQDDKDLVHEFVNANGLTCLIKVGAEADQNYQNYILRALGQIMLYVDGMNGVIEHRETVRWLYTLIASRFRLVVKTTLKLLLVFVEYTETNALLLLDAVRHVDPQRRQKPWTNIMKVLDEKDGIDSELLVYAMTLVNKTLSNIPDQDTFYDITDALEALGMEAISQRHQNKQGNELDLVEQFKIYELALKHEDGDEDVTASTTPGLTIKWNRDRKKSELAADRKSLRRHSANLSQLTEQSILENVQAEKEEEAVKSLPSTPINSKQPTEQDVAQDVTQMNKRNRSRREQLQKQHLNMQQSKTPVNELVANKAEENRKLLSQQSQQRTDPTTSPKPWQMKKPTPTHEEKNTVVNSVRYGSAVTANTEDFERKRRQRDQNRDRRRIDLMNKQNEVSKSTVIPSQLADQQSTPPPPPTRTSSSRVLESGRAARFLQKNNISHVKPEFAQKTPNNHVNRIQNQMQPKITMDGDVITVEDYETPKKVESPPKTVPKIQLLQDNESKTSQAPPATPSGDVISTKQKLMMDMLYSNQAVATIRTSESDEASGDELAKDDKPSTESERTDSEESKPQNGEIETVSVSATKAAMEKLLQNQLSAKQTSPSHEQSTPQVVKPVTPEVPSVPKKDSDLMWEKLLEQSTKHSLIVSEFDFTDLTSADDIDIISKFTAPVRTLPPSGSIPPGPPPPPPPVPGAPPAPPPPIAPPPPAPSVNGTGSSQSSKKPRTIRLFWKEVKESGPKSFKRPSTVWESIDDVEINESKVAHLFELRTKDIAKKQQTDKKNRINILDPKRSNAINIGLTVLPPPRTIKSAILHMDEFTLNKEQIDKLMTMIPTQEESARIQDAMRENPDVPLGNAEQFLLTLSSVSELSARLHLWSFKLDYEIQEKEVAEPLIDLRDGMKQLKENKTFRKILAVLKSIGNFLNSSKAKGFDVRYLTKVPEVKDTVHKQSLLHHLTQMVLQHFPDSTDFYSDIGSVTRASKVDFTLLEETLENLERRCKEAWDHLKTIARHETKATQRDKMSNFLLGAAKRIITLGVVHKRLLNRFHETLVFFGLSPQEAVDTSPSSFCRMISEFALEYRTARERALTQQLKRQKRGERNKTRGKMITETRKFSQTEEQIKQKQMEMALGNGDDSLVQTTTRRRQRGRNSKGNILSVLHENQILQRGNDEAPSSIPNGRTSMDATTPKTETTGEGAPVRRRTSRKIVDDHSDETIMDQLVKAATQTPHERTRRRRARNSSRKSLRRTLKHGLTDEEKAVIMGKI